MKSLYESIFDIDDNIENVEESIKTNIIKFICKYYDNTPDEIEFNGKNRNGKYIVDSKYTISTSDNSIKNLTNGLFVWGNVKDFECYGHNLVSLEGAPEKVSHVFDCAYCRSLKSLKGCPKKVEMFSCDACDSLTSLEGAPEEVKFFSCRFCNSLESLEGAPKKVDGQFHCHNCRNLKSLKGAPKETYDFHCYNCPSLDSLDGCPKKVKNNFDCRACARIFTHEEITKLCKVGGKINQ